MPRTANAPSFTATNAGSLLTTAEWLDNAERLGDGVSFKPENCDNGATLEICPVSPVTKTVPAPDGIVTVPTYADYYGVACSTMGGDFDEAAGRARRGLEVRRSFKVERALWDGVGTITDSSALASTAANDITPGLGAGIVTGIGALVGALDAVLGGARGLIHVPQSLIPILTFYGLAFRNGNFLQVSNTDHNIVAGTGYSGNDPDGNAPAAGFVWAYATGPVTVMTTSIDVIPEASWQAIDTSTNDMEVRAEFAFASFFNPCAHIAIELCTPDPGPECGTT